MRWKILALFMIALLCASLSACNMLGIEEALALDEKKHIPILHVDEDRYLIQDHTYYLPTVEFLQGSGGQIEASGKYEYIGWTGDRFVYSEFYGDSAESPVFVYVPNSGHTFLREDYDYTTDTFLVEGTEITLCFADDLLDTEYANTNLFNRKTIDISISSVTHPTLTAPLYLVKDGVLWYGINHHNKVFVLSKRLIDLLIENEIIVTQ